jgi:hypothetical protein
LIELGKEDVKRSETVKTILEIYEGEKVSTDVCELRERVITRNVFGDAALIPKSDIPNSKLI